MNEIIPITHFLESSSFNLDLIYITFSKENYYCLIKNEPRILKLDKNFNKICFIKTQACYSTLCYDYKSSCFYVTSPNSNSKIFKLNENFKEIATISLPKEPEIKPAITGISYNCCENSLYLCSNSEIFSFNLASYKLNTIKNLGSHVLIDITAVCPYTIITFNNTLIGVLNKDNEIITVFNLLTQYKIKSILLSPCKKNSSTINLTIIATDCICSNYILDVPIDIANLNFKLCDCNYLNCQCQNDLQIAIANFIQSIALMETSLAHILNAEGEKIQDALKKTNDLGEIIAINKSVSESIENATELEKILVEKLKTLKDCTDF